MNINQEGLELIKKFEGLSLKAYPDTGGVWTIGRGHIKNVYPGLEITKEEADQLLKEDLLIFERGVDAVVKVPLHGNQFSALVCFSFNVGLSALKSSTLLKLVNQCNFSGAADQFLKWNQDNGKVINGLTLRRQAERKLFLTS